MQPVHSSRMHTFIRSPSGFSLRDKYEYRAQRCAQHTVFSRGSGTENHFRRNGGWNVYRSTYTCISIFPGIRFIQIYSKERVKIFCPEGVEEGFFLFPSRQSFNRSTVYREVYFFFFCAIHHLRAGCTRINVVRPRGTRGFLSLSFSPCLFLYLSPQDIIIHRRP